MQVKKNYLRAPTGARIFLRPQQIKQNFKTRFWKFGAGDEIRTHDIFVGTEVLVWSLVHGYAMLFASSANRDTPDGPVPDFARILPDFPLA